MKSKAKPQMDDLVQSIGEIARAGRRLARQAETQYTSEVEDILRTRCRDSRRIEHLLDRMLDFGFDPAMVRLYKKLCRYYFEIDPRATASYVYAYRDLWDEEGQEKGKEKAAICESTKLQDIIAIEKGKPPELQPYFGPDAELYLTPEYLRSKSSAEFVKPSANAVRVLDGETIVLWDGSNAGEFFKARKGILSSTMTRISHTDEFDKAYFFYAVKNWEPYLKGQTAGSGIPHIDKDVLENIEILRFNKAEQTKIAEILLTVDRAIEQTEALIAKQQRIKTGLMQDLLTRGIDEHGNLRSEQTHQFKDSPLGRIPVDWEVSYFGNRVNLVHGHQFRNYDFTEAGLPIVKISQVTEKGLNMPGCSYVAASREKEFSAYKIRTGDVLMALTGATLGKVCRVSSDFNNQVLLQNYRVGRFEPIFQKDIDKKYLYFVLQTDQFLNQVFSRVNSGAQGNIGKADFERALIKLPQYDEQRKAGELMLLNNKRQFQLQQNLCKLRSLKTALMQDLLTGKVRVTPLLAELQEAAGA